MSPTVASNDVVEATTIAEFVNLALREGRRLVVASQDGIPATWFLQRGLELLEVAEEAPYWIQGQRLCKAMTALENLEYLVASKPEAAKQLALCMQRNGLNARATSLLTAIGATDLADQN